MMLAELLAHEGAIRSAAFVLVLTILVVAERLRPFRGDNGPARRRLRNYALVLIDSLLLRISFPVLAVGFSVIVADAGIGLFNRVPTPTGLAIALSLLLLDLGIYWQHRLLHLVPALWRLHRVHHSDSVFDVSLGVRFHPIEIALSMLWKLALVALLGAPPLAVLIYEVLLSAASLFAHADVTLPASVQPWLQRILVTPDMHRVHHSVHRDETDSNFGSVLVLWDRCFGSFRLQPRNGQRAMQFGTQGFEDPASRTLVGLLLHPFRKVPSEPTAARSDR